MAYCLGFITADGCGSYKKHKLITFISCASYDFLSDMCLKIGFGRVNKANESIIYNNEPFSLQRKKNIMFSVNRSDIEKRYLTKKEIEYILQNFTNSENSISKVCNLLSLTKFQLLVKVRRLGICNKPHRKWSKEDILYVKNNYAPQNHKKSINNINQTLASIEYFLTRNNIRFIRKKVTKQEKDFILQNREIGIDWLSLKLGRTKSSIYNIINRMGINYEC